MPRKPCTWQQDHFLWPRKWKFTSQAGASCQGRRRERERDGVEYICTNWRGKLFKSTLMDFPVSMGGEKVLTSFSFYDLFLYSTFLGIKECESQPHFWTNSEHFCICWEQQNLNMWKGLHLKIFWKNSTDVLPSCNSLIFFRALSIVVRRNPHTHI